MVLVEETRKIHGAVPSSSFSFYKVTRRINESSLPTAATRSNPVAPYVKLLLGPYLPPGLLAIWKLEWNWMDAGEQS